MKKLLFIALAIGLASCSPRKQAQLRQINAETMAKYWENQIEFDYLSMRSKIAFTQDGQTTNATLNLRMKKDSVIWASVSVMGLFEAARVLVTKDSIKMVNRLEGSYTARSVDYLKELIGIDIELLEVQNILIGNAPFEASNYALITEDSLTVLQAMISEQLLSTIRMDETYRTYRSDVQGVNRTESAHLRYASYKDFNGTDYPSDITAKIFMSDSMSKVEIAVQSIKDVQIDQFPFTVPSSYIRI